MRFLRSIDRELLDMLSKRMGERYRLQKPEFLKRLMQIMVPHAMQDFQCSIFCDISGNEY